MKAFLEISDPKANRSFLPADFEIKDWDGLKPFYDQLLAAEPAGVEGLQEFLARRSELEAVVSEAFAWRYIRMTRYTDNESYKQDYQFFVQQISPQLSSYSDKLNRKIAAHPNFGDLPTDPYQTYVRQLDREIKLFREENIPLGTEASTVSQEYNSLAGAMTVEHGGEQLTMQQAGKFLESQDRSLRQEIWEKMNERRQQDRAKLEEVYDKLVGLRHKMAQNAGYESFTSYKFDSMGRFDYQLEDTHAFHQAVEEVVKPVYEQLMRERQERLGVEKLRPWDLSVDIFGEEPLKPFEGSQQLLDRSVAALSHLRPELGEMLRIMDNMGFLDLESRQGKSPGGYNYPLMETGVPFIFMNAAGTQTDVITMLHESGHAIHSFLTRNLPLTDVKHTPSEVAELASMSMELLSLDYYDEFYQDEHDLKRAQKNQLLRCITIFPWIATIDAFQQWVYDNPNHTHEERVESFTALYHRFHGETVDWSGYESIRESLWIKQGHVYDVPFYYIEYAIAQLGALAVWQKYRKNPDEGLSQYLDALKLGYTQPIPTIYETAGIRFDLSSDYVKSCVDFCLDAYQEIEL